MQEKFEKTSSNQAFQSGDMSSLMGAFRTPYRVVAFGLSDIGLVRQNNEDVWAELPDIHFFVLADGMGGHQAGEVAAKETVNALCHLIKDKIPHLQNPSSSELRNLIRRAITHVNSHVYKMGRGNQELRGMGTTLCCLLFYNEGIAFAHVGDSRIYRLRGSKLEQLTKDHSLLCELIDQGRLNEREATDFLYKNIITKAIGTEAKVDPSIATRKVQPGDLYLMCSDGLSDTLSAIEIAAILIKSSSLKAAAETLIDSVNEKGGQDNTTLVIVKVEELNAPKDISR